MRLAFASRIGVVSLLAWACGSPAPEAAKFDARAAYAEFERTLREDYAYLERADFDVEAHLQRTRAAAEQAADRDAFRRVLHRSTFAFTDPQGSECVADLLGALHITELAASGVTLEMGAEALFHVDGTPRAEFVGDVRLAAADRDADGGDPALAAALAWFAAM